MATTNANCPTGESVICTSDVLTYTDFASFPGTGEVDTIYVDNSTGIQYSWNGTTYVQPPAGSSVLDPSDYINDLGVGGTGAVETGFPLYRDTITNSAGFTREFNNNVHFNIGDGITNTGANSLVVGSTINNTARLVSISGRSHTNTGESSNITGAINNNTVSFSSMYGRQNFNTAESSQVGGAGNENNGPFSNVIGSGNVNELTSGYVGGFGNNVDGDAGLTVGQNVTVDTGGEYKGLTYGKDILVTGALSSVGGLGNIMNSGGRNVLAGEFNVLTDANYSGVFSASSTVTGGGHNVGGIGHTVDGNNNITNGSNNDTNGFNSVAMLGVDLTAVRSEQTHMNHIYVNPAYRAFSTVTIGMAATLPGEVFFVGGAGTAQQMYRHG